MCAVSAVYDYGSRTPIDHWDWALSSQFKDLVEDAKKFYRATKQPHCEDPKNMEFEKQVLERLERLEKKL